MGPIGIADLYSMSWEVLVQKSRLVSFLHSAVQGLNPATEISRLKPL